MSGVRVFRYIEPLDAFLVTDEYRSLAEQLGLAEWHPAVWIGRLFTLDNDYGEHWFDNWEEREAQSGRAAQLGINVDDLLIVVPGRFAKGDDGPCHPPPCCGPRIGRRPRPPLLRPSGPRIPGWRIVNSGSLRSGT